MNKDTNADGELNPKPPAVVGRILWANQKSIKRITLTMLCFFLVPALLVVSYLVYKDKTTINTSKLNKLMTVNDCSSKAAKSTDFYKLNPKNLDATILLLHYRSKCQLQAKNYKQVVALDRQIKSYFLKKNDTTDAKAVDEQISSLQDILSHPATTTNANNVKGPQANPQLLDAIKQLSQQK